MVTTSPPSPFPLMHDLHFLFPLLNVGKPRGNIVNVNMYTFNPTSLYTTLLSTKHVQTCLFTPIHYLLAIPAASALAKIFAPTLRIFIAARSIPPFLALSYILRAVSRLSAGLLVVVLLRSKEIVTYLTLGLLLD